MARRNGGPFHVQKRKKDHAISRTLDHEKPQRKNRANSRFD
jgi:hypothetical protein